MPAQHLYALEGYRGVSYHAILALWQRCGCTVLLRRALTGRRSHMTHCPPMGPCVISGDLYCLLPLVELGTHAH